MHVPERNCFFSQNNWVYGRGLCCKTGKLVKEKISDQWFLKTKDLACKLTFELSPPLLQRSPKLT